MATAKGMPSKFESKAVSSLDIAIGGGEGVLAATLNFHLCTFKWPLTEGTGMREIAGARTSAAKRLVSVAFVVVVGGCVGAPRAPQSEGGREPASVGELAIRASRVFAGPTQYPPMEFAAYGIVAFQSEATSDSFERYVAICEGFMASLPTGSALREREIPLDRQMATVWPLIQASVADELNGAVAEQPTKDRCHQAVQNIDLVTSLRAIAAAKRGSGGGEFKGRGPYLLAWSPSMSFGSRDVLVLQSDMSQVTTSDQATRMFSQWRMDIQQNPDLWRNGWDWGRLRTLIADWADRYGPGILSAFCLLE